jgi:hypothetical protein
VMVAKVATVVMGVAIKVMATSKLAEWFLALIDKCGDSGSWCPKLTPSFQSTALYFAEIGTVAWITKALCPAMVPQKSYSFTSVISVCKLGQWPE